MLNKTSRTSSLFLIEIILAVFLFCICAAICVRLFASANQISKDSENLTMAVSQTTNLAELFRHDEDFYENITSQYPHATMLSDQILLSFDENWIHCTKTTSRYQITVFCKQSGCLLQANFTATDTQKEETLYFLNCERYAKEGTP